MERAGAAGSIRVRSFKRGRAYGTRRIYHTMYHAFSGALGTCDDISYRGAESMIFMKSMIFMDSMIFMKSMIFHEIRDLGTPPQNGPIRPSGPPRIRISTYPDSGGGGPGVARGGKPELDLSVRGPVRAAGTPPNPLHVCNVPKGGSGRHSHLEFPFFHETPESSRTVEVLPVPGSKQPQAWAKPISVTATWG